jgi:hypothetical protein
VWDNEQNSGQNCQAPLSYANLEITSEISHGYLALDSQLPQTTGLNSSVFLETDFNSLSSNAWPDLWDMYPGCGTGLLPEGTWDTPSHILGSQSLASASSTSHSFPREDVPFSTFEAQNIELPGLHQNLNRDFGAQNLTSSQHNRSHSLSNQPYPRFTGPFQSNDQGSPPFDPTGIQGPGPFVSPDPHHREYSRLRSLKPSLPIGVESRPEPLVSNLPSAEQSIVGRSSGKRSLSLTKDNAKKTRTRRKRNVCVRCRLMKELVRHFIFHITCSDTH